MTSPVEKLTVRCPECGCRYETWHRPSVNLALDDFDEDYLHEATHGRCPTCGFEVALGALVVRGEVQR